MANASVTISGFTNIPGGTSLNIGPIYITSAAPIGANNEFTLASGDNQIFIPTGTTLVIVQLAATNAVVTKLAGAASGSSFAITLLAAGGIAMFEPASGQTSFYLNSASLQTTLTTVTFI